MELGLKPRSLAYMSILPYPVLPSSLLLGPFPDKERSPGFEKLLAIPLPFTVLTVGQSPSALFSFTLTRRKSTPGLHLQRRGWIGDN